MQLTQHSIHYGEELIRFSLRRQPLRTAQRLAIHVEPDGSVLVDAPESSSLESVLIAVKKRVRWISEHVAAARERLNHILPREYVSGESLHYLGRRYRLKVLVQADAVPETRMRGGFIVVTVPEPSSVIIQQTLDAWFRIRAREVFRIRLAAVAAPLHWVKHSPPTRLQCMKVQWGSCSPAGRITLNPMLVKAPRECIDYVLLHELCHLLHHNHGPKFYKTLDRTMPGWHSIKEKLDNMAEEILRV
ncbi:M48 family metallopeptidase [Janthinobacterium agaricidamnosum]|uniref:M48 family metallopeptidase n=1 Tax=Janthinobacterium agaricidamnosum TaxID=55508 RepID=UPI001F57F7AE|nr:YgjP-like metallopeptidase domain-containing protein [Janthinobacterium agaricidamnosum]